MLDRLRLTDVGPARELSLEAAPRLNALTGDNGLGKSFALDVVWWALTGSWAGATAAPFIQSPAGAAGRLAPRIEWALSGSAAPQASTFDWRGVRWKRPAGERPTSALVFYARVDGSFSVWDPHRNDWKPDAADLDRPERPAAYHFHKDAVWYGLHADGADEPINEGLLRDWVRWQLKSKAGDVDDLDPFELLTAAMQTLSPTPDEVLRPGPTVRPPGATRDEPSLVFDYGIVPVRHASAGVRRILALAYLVVWSWYEHRLAARAIQTRPADRIVVLLDEVETHLHPQWQRRLMPALMTVLTGLSADLNVQVMLTTHSPLVLASLEPEFDPEQDRLFLFEQQAARVTLRALPWTPFGDAVGWLLSPVFALEQARSVPAERAIEAAEAFMRDDHAELPADLATADAIDAELRRVLPGDDPFWPRWVLSTGHYGR